MRTRAKICEIPVAKICKLWSDAGADAIGFVFFPPSPRHVSAAQAKELIQHVPAYVQTVRLFVNATADDIADVLKQVALDIIQFHGDETPEAVRQLQHKLDVDGIKPFRSNLNWMWLQKFNAFNRQGQAQCS